MLMTLLYQWTHSCLAGLCYHMQNSSIKKHSIPTPTAWRMTLDTVKVSKKKVFKTVSVWFLYVLQIRYVMSYSRSLLHPPGMNNQKQWQQFMLFWGASKPPWRIKASKYSMFSTEIFHLISHQLLGKYCSPMLCSSVKTFVFFVFLKSAYKTLGFH